ncbi:uncharacterized protein TRAVEDRAFT_41118 [Trametes versicolor FP-101664 SS1]|uniref:uncharacterized protein n=1 Tax=Trametes versicolor (strain FP-101664) TaxID=717944 RepID=UPI0004621807|nr:uncharacterized protein TRAVEDRAFT_41118 [Trametes versicolor FP-101664 SS1]EIW63689.1 hypothetical protein TRAVEDRAFT_41118 [Trametes versicolor FP-101664 SS1]
MPQLASQTSAGRSQMALDNPMFMSFQNQLIRPATIHGIPQIPNNSQFNFNALPIPPNLSPNLGPTHAGDKSQRVNPTTEGLITPARAARRQATTLGVGAHAGGGAGVRGFGAHRQILGSRHPPSGFHHNAVLQPSDAYSTCLHVMQAASPAVNTPSPLDTPQYEARIVLETRQNEPSTRPPLVLHTARPYNLSMSPSKTLLAPIQVCVKSRYVPATLRRRHSHESSSWRGAIYIPTSPAPLSKPHARRRVPRPSNLFPRALEALAGGVEVLRDAHAYECDRGRARRREARFATSDACGGFAAFREGLGVKRRDLRRASRGRPGTIEAGLRALQEET